jgi:hypothetical protein
VAVDLLGVFAVGDVAREFAPHAPDEITMVCPRGGRYGRRVQSSSPPPACTWSGGPADTSRFSLVSSRPSTLRITPPHRGQIDRRTATNVAALRGRSRGSTRPGIHAADAYLPAYQKSCVVTSVKSQQNPMRWVKNRRTASVPKFGAPYTPLTPATSLLIAYSRLVMPCSDLP